MAEAQAHPAVALILEAEAEPALGYAHARITEPLAVATQLDPERLPEPWVLRLALRLAEGLLQAGTLDRAGTWLTVAGERLDAGRPTDRVAHATLTARLRLRHDRHADLAPTLATARAALAQAAPEDREALETRVRLVEAEAAWAQARFRPILDLLAGRLHQAGAFRRVDDLWRAQRLLGLARHARLDFAGAAEQFAAEVALCEHHEAPIDQAEALLYLGRCRLGAHDGAGAMAAFERARALAPEGSAPFDQVVGAVALARLAQGDEDGALAEAQAGAIAAARADDHRRYVEWIGVTTHLHRILGRHEAIYRQLLAIYGTLKRSLGDDAAAPILPLIDRLRADLGNEGFEALSQKLLSEQTRH
ncbi:MAG: hypothetical protein H6702_13045 [Myxococcales bacterium]|nr:hypothetical protein [Myxococcales bacterium]